MQRLGLICLLVMALSASAHADATFDAQLQNAQYGPTAGILAAVTPALVGGILLATSDGKLQTQTSAIILMQSGFALAPLVTHAAAGEWRRGLVFSAVPMASIIGMLVLLHERPTVFTDSNRNGTRYAFASLLGLSVVSGVVGIFDGFATPDRLAHRRKKNNTVIAPQLLPSGGGLALSRSF